MIAKTGLYLLFCVTLSSCSSNTLPSIFIESREAIPQYLTTCPDRVPLAGAKDQKELAIRLLQNETADDLCRERLKAIHDLENTTN